jgi:predicted GIY-YIG superfamily endonuclease
MLYIYILELESNKYYIGKTTNPEFRLETHFDGSASAWTNKYKPVKIIEIFGGCDNFDEDKYTLKYMEKYGSPTLLATLLR